MLAIWSFFENALETVFILFHEHIIYLRTNLLLNKCTSVTTDAAYLWIGLNDVVPDWSPVLGFDFLEFLPMLSP